jgi:hypothetical protein
MRENMRNGLLQRPRVLVWIVVFGERLVAWVEDLRSLFIGAQNLTRIHTGTCLLSALVIAEFRPLLLCGLQYSRWKDFGSCTSSTTECVRMIKTVATRPLHPQIMHRLDILFNKEEVLR